MYKTASEYLGFNKNHLMEPYKNVGKQDPQYIHNRIQDHMHEPPSHNSNHNHSHNSIPKIEDFKSDNEPQLHYKTMKYQSLGDPKVWGPPFWFSLHTSAIFYPEKPSALYRDKMKARILAIPYEIPCAACKPHASAFVEKHKRNLDSIVSSRDSLFNFYVDFHNQVNMRYNKPTWTYDQAKKYYSGGAKVTSMTY